MGNAPHMVLSILLSWLTATLGLWLAANVLDGVRITSFVDAIWAGALLGVLQGVLTGPIFVVLGISTLGIGFLLWFLTRWVASAIVILVTAALSRRVEVDGFIPALVTAFIVAATGTVVRWVL